MRPITILIADDHKLVRESWAYILNSYPDFKVIAECGDAEEVVEVALQQSPDITLMDINMPPTSGIDAVRKIRKQRPKAKIIAVSMHAQSAYVKKMLRVGAMGYITKNSSKEEMQKAILEVFSGKKYICEEVKNVLSTELTDESQKVPGIEKLSYREMQISDYIMKGFSSKEIASDLNISFKTVEVHRHNILKKLNIKNSISLVNIINAAQHYTGKLFAEANHG
jgi:DNA-binding NarL/FixJ family response regulator